MAIVLAKHEEHHLHTKDTEDAGHTRGWERQRGRKVLYSPRGSAALPPDP